MQYSFTAETVNLGIDDTEEAYTITFAQESPDGGPAQNYLLMQRSVEGIKDGEPEFVEPYVEFNDASNGRFATSFAKAVLGIDSFEMVIKPGSGIVTHPGVETSNGEIDKLVVNFDIDPAMHRKVRLAMNLVIADGFEFEMLA